MMKKVKVTKQTAAASEIILKPDWVRMLILNLFLFALAISAGLLIRSGLDRVWVGLDWFKSEGPFFLAVLLIGSVLVASMERPRWTMRLLNGDILEGPTGVSGQRIEIPLKEIDWVRTRRSLSSGFGIGNSIYAKSNNRILVSRWYYNPAEFRDFLSSIGGD